MNNLQYKRLTIDDIPSMPSILEDDNMEFSRENLRNFIADSRNYGFVAKLDDKAVAFAYGYGILRPDGKNMFYIHSVGVLPEFRNQGIGTKLMEYVVNYIKEEKQYYKFFLLTEKANIRACKVYEKFADHEEQVLFSGKLGTS